VINASVHFYDEYLTIGERGRDTGEYTRLRRSVKPEIPPSIVVVAGRAEICMASITANVKFTQRVLRKVDERVRIRPGGPELAEAMHANAGTSNRCVSRHGRFFKFGSCIRQNILSLLATRNLPGDNMGTCYMI